MKAKLIIPLIFIIILSIYGVGVNNSLVQLEEETSARWSQVENQYQRRMDLIPNLVNTVKGAANFEQETLTQVIEARSKASSIQLTRDALNDPQAMERFQAAQGQLSSALSRLMVTVEKYPELKANQNFRDLQVQLEGTENRISNERMRFNEAARGFNTKVRSFPSSIIASLSGFERVPYFEAEQGAEKAPSVDFGS